MKRTLALVMAALLPSIVAAQGNAEPAVVATLRAQLQALNIASPESDAQRDIANGHPYCFSINGYATFFPGVAEKDRSYCEAREKNFKGTSDVILGGTDHGKLQSQAVAYAKRYNIYVLEHRTK